MLDQAAVHSLDRFELGVPDLAEARHFYEAFGLDVETQDGGLLLRTAGSEHVWATLLPRDRKRLLVAPKTTLDARLPFAIAPDGGDGIRGAASRSGIAKVRPRRLAHISLFVRDVQQSIDFFTTVLGLRLSDRSGNDVAFLHASHGSDHHLVALARSNGPGLHHCSWDVPTLADVGLGAMQMAEAGYTRGWGLGRHVLGSNYFHYVRDPWGSYSEYSADMDFIPAGADWRSGDHPGEDSFYQWGPPPPDDFIVNHEMAM
jgi:catechol 2,3-dioxygenase